VTRSEYVSELRELIGSRLLLLPAVTAVIRDEGGRFLLARHVAGDRWGLVGGAIEPLETPRDALRREIAEELGVESTVGAVIDVYGGADLVTEYPNGDRVGYVTTAYFCVLAAPPMDLARDELSEVAWFPPDEIAGLRRFEWIDRVVADAGRLGGPRRLGRVRDGDGDSDRDVARD
jgi:8-oxo-dGTP pyrophosphatase MutT (NUDIX family)